MNNGWVEASIHHSSCFQKYYHQGQRDTEPPRDGGSHCHQSLASEKCSVHLSWVTPYHVHSKCKPAFRVEGVWPSSVPPNTEHSGFFCLFCFLKIDWLIDWLLCWVFVSVRGLSLVAASGGHSSSRCAGLSLLWPLWLRSTGARRAGSVVVAHGPSCSAACGIFPDQGSNPCPLHWQADSQPLRHQGSPEHSVLCIVCNQQIVIEWTDECFST